MKLLHKLLKEHNMVETLKFVQKFNEVMKQAISDILIQFALKITYLMTKVISGAFFKDPSVW